MTQPPVRGGTNRIVNLRRVDHRGHPSEFYVVSTLNTLEPRAGEYLSQQQADGLIVLDGLDVRIEAKRPNKHWKRT